MTTTALPRTSHGSPPASAIGRGTVHGAAAGILASLVMAMFAMIAAVTYQGVGLFTPLYHIASTLLPADAMTTSMQAATAGSPVTWLAGPALVGALVHMMIGAMYGAVFGAAATLLRLRGRRLVTAGVAWGALVFVISSFVALPVVAALVGSGDQIAQMASMVGYGTFAAEHVLFGLVLGAVLTVRSSHSRR